MHFPSLTCSIRKPLLPCCKLKGLVTLPNPSGECQMVPWMSQAMGVGSQSRVGKRSQHGAVSVNPKPIFFAPISTCDLPKMFRAQRLFFYLLQDSQVFLILSWEKDVSILGARGIQAHDDLSTPCMKDKSHKPCARAPGSHLRTFSLGDKGPQSHQKALTGTPNGFGPPGTAQG